MKKILTAVTFLLSTFFGQAQLRLGVHADGIFASQISSYNDLSVSTGSRLSWKAGVVANVGIKGPVSFMPQVNLLSKGSKFDFSQFSESYHQVTKLTYLEVPLNVVYNAFGFFGGLGPVVSYGLSGKQTASDGTETLSQDVKFDGKNEDSDNDTHYKALELGGNLIAGYKLQNGVFFKASYNFGLTNISPAAAASDGKVKNNYFGLGIGYFFKK